jgi:hypothetical protein
MRAGCKVALATGPNPQHEEIVMSQAETKPTKGSPKRNGAELIVQAEGLTLAERMDAIREATHDAHAARVAEARRAFETRIVDLVQARVDHVLDGVLGE